MTPTLNIDEIKQIPLELLKFDIRNPRLTPDHRPDGNENWQIIKALSDHEDLGELITSIAANGYLDFEPLIVMQEEGLSGNSGPFVVLEGNRRLAALLFLLDKNLSEKCRISYPDVVHPDLKKQTQEIRVNRVKGRDAAWAYIGFKHVNGAQMWDAYPKALYLTDWYLSELKKDPDTTLTSLSAKLGDRHDTIKRMVNGNLALRQAHDRDLFHVNDRSRKTKFYFSHFYTAMSRLDYCNYANLEKNWILNDTPRNDPLTGSQLSKVGEILRWIYGLSLYTSPSPRDRG